MPTPRPIRAPRIGAKSTTFMAWVSGVIAISPPPTPAMAVTSGSSIARREPNAMNSTTAAASTPTVELVGGGGARAGKREGIVVVALDGLRERAEAEQHDHPGRDDHEPVVIAPPRDGRHDSPRMSRCDLIHRSGSGVPASSAWRRVFGVP